MMRISEGVGEFFRQEVFTFLLGVLVGVAGTVAFQMWVLR
jgi:hypothetical protein